MANSSPLFGLSPHRSLPPGGPAPTTHVMVQHPLRYVLAFTGRSIDDVVNDPIAKNEVLGYYKLSRFVKRRGEAIDLERQWNPLGLRTG